MLDSPTAATRLPIAAFLAVAALTLFVSIGDLGSQAVHPGLVVFHGLVGAAIVVGYFVRAPGRADYIDRRLLVGFLLMSVTAIVSTTPRQSLAGLLVALLYLAALFFARGILAERRARRLLIAGLRCLSILFTALVVTQFVGPTVEWLGLTGWRIAPPLDLRLVVQPWGIRHDAALLVVLLYPSWWAGAMTRTRLVVALVIGGAVGAILLLDGSRTLWLATGVAALYLGLPRLAPVMRSAGGRGRLVVVGLVAGLLVALAASVGAAAVERLLRVAPVGERASLWNALISGWTERPLTGHGPDSFTWMLRSTGYFDTNSFAPRHADSVPIQTLAETGLIGLAAIAIVVWTFLPIVSRGRSAAARFAIVVFVASGLSLNPTQTAAVMAVAILWTAYACPRVPAEGPAVDGWHKSRFIFASAMGLVVIVVTAATSVAHVAYLEARAAAEDGRVAAAIDDLSLSASLDPGMALYHRQLGTAQFLAGDNASALVSLRSAIALNRQDDLTWRAFAMVLREEESRSEADAALREAIRVQRSDPTNMLLAIRATPASPETVAELLQAWPYLVAAHHWTLPNDVEAAAAVAAAQDRWRQHLPSPEPLVDQPLFLAALGANGNPAIGYDESRLSPTLRDAYLAVMTCSTDHADALDRTTASDRRTSTYWLLKTRAAELTGQDSSGFRRIYRLMTGASPESEAPLDPLHENGKRDASADTRGYGRPPIYWISGVLLPAPDEGVAQWILHPREAAERVGADGTQATCANR